MINSQVYADPSQYNHLSSTLASINRFSLLNNICVLYYIVLMLCVRNDFACSQQISAASNELAATTMKWSSLIFALSAHFHLMMDTNEWEASSSSTNTAQQQSCSSRYIFSLFSTTCLSFIPPQSSIACCLCKCLEWIFIYINYFHDE